MFFRLWVKQRMIGLFCWDFQLVSYVNPQKQIVILKSSLIKKMRCLNSTKMIQFIDHFTKFFGFPYENLENLES